VQYTWAGVAGTLGEIVRISCWLAAPLHHTHVYTSSCHKVGLIAGMRDSTGYLKLTKRKKLKENKENLRSQDTLVRPDCTASTLEWLVVSKFRND